MVEREWHGFIVLSLFNASYHLLAVVILGNGLDALLVVLCVKEWLLGGFGGLWSYGNRDADTLLPTLRFAAFALPANPALKA